MNTTTTPEGAGEFPPLKPCPFCGHVGLDFREGSTFRWLDSSCAGCGASIGETRIQTLGQGTKEEWMADAKRDAIAAWNRRAQAAEGEPSAPEAAPAPASEAVAYANPVILLPDEDGEEEWSAKVQSHRDNVFSLPLYAAPTGSESGDAVDAHRYRWLKERNSGPIGIVAWHRDEEKEMVLVDEHADAAIDAALQGVKPQGDA